MSLTVKNKENVSPNPVKVDIKKLESEIVSLKTLNNERFYDLQKSKESIKLLERENHDLKLKHELAMKDCEEKVRIVEQQLVILKSELQNVNNQLEVSKKDNNRLKGKCQELQLGIDQSKTNSDFNLSDEEKSGNYEVEKILDHKMKRKTRFYLVRWAEYDPSHDSWVSEHDLCCPKVLENYKKLRNID